MSSLRFGHDAQGVQEKTKRAEALPVRSGFPAAARKWRPQSDATTAAAETATEPRVTPSRRPVEPANRARRSVLGTHQIDRYYSTRSAIGQIGKRAMTGSSPRGFPGFEAARPVESPRRSGLAEPDQRPPGTLVILGIDPGSRHTGWGIVERRGSRLSTLGHGRISLSTRAPLAERLVTLGDEMAALVHAHRPQVAALESLFHGVNPRSLIVLAQARGAILATLCRCGLEIHEYSPAEVKSAVTGNGRADKQQVAKMVGLLLGQQAGRVRRARAAEPKPSADATDALAVALCYGQRARLDRLIPRERAERTREGGGTPDPRGDGSAETP